MERAYLDNNATSPPLPAVVEAMLPFLGGGFGNPSSQHTRGERARTALERARSQVARLLGAAPAEIVFTSGGTEADNLALAGVAAGGHLITSAIEHPAVLETARWLERQGTRVTRVPVDPRGVVDPESVRAAIRGDTRLISIMAANNETGVLQPIEELGRIAAAAGVPLHTDAVQAAGKLPLDVGRLGCSLLTLSGHKLHGPQGVGALYVRAGTVLRPLLRGGGQERGRRAGTENLPGLVGLGAAAEQALAWLAGDGPRALAALRDRLEQGILAAVPAVTVNGGAAPRVPNTSNLSVRGLAGRALVAALDDEGISISTGAACASAGHQPPHVLLAMGLSALEAGSAVRLSLGKQTTAGEIGLVLEQFPRAVARLRALSPLWPQPAAHRQ